LVLTEKPPDVPDQYRNPPTYAKHLLSWPWCRGGKIFSRVARRGVMNKALNYDEIIVQKSGKNQEQLDETEVDN